MRTNLKGRGLPFAGALLALAVACGGQDRAELTAAARADTTPTYLALGDSVSYGLDPHLTPKVPFTCFSCGTFTATQPPASGDVFVGYPEYLQPRLGAALVDASCPGETSASFDARVRTGQAQICNYFKAQDWLHASYGSTQEAFGLDTLAHRRVQLVTLQIGANDVLDLVAACGGDSTCVQNGIGDVLLRVYGNVSGVLSSIRGAGYSGRIVVMGYYAPSPDWTQLVYGLNQYLAAAAAAAGATMVDLQPVFGTTACANGLLILADPLNPAAGCDVHPSQQGAQLIANTVASALGL